MDITTAAVEKTPEELRKELFELQRQHREINQRLRDPRGIRRNFASSANGNGGARQRGLVRPADRADRDDQPPAKRRLSSAVVKVEEGEIVENDEGSNDVKNDLGSESAFEGVVVNQRDRRLSNSQQYNHSRRESNQRGDVAIPDPMPVPRVLPKDQDPILVNRNRRMFGQVLGTLEKFRKEDMQLSGTDAYMRRSTSLQKAEQKAREESEKLRQQEREQIAEKRRRDLTLRARVSAKAEEKKLELLFLQWTEHQKKLGIFQRTKAEPPIYYCPVKPLEEDAALVEQHKEQVLQEWKAARREELSEYQKQIAEQYLANVENEVERWQNSRRAGKVNNDTLNLQETMDQELDTHRLEHGPKKRKIPGGSNNDDEDDVEDINVGDDDMMDDVLGVDENNRTVEEAAKKQEADSPRPQSEQNGQE